MNDIDREKMDRNIIAAVISKMTIRLVIMIFIGCSALVSLGYAALEDHKGQPRHNGAPDLEAFEALHEDVRELRSLLLDRLPRKEKSRAE